jgi:hypothetical protein
MRGLVTAGRDFRREWTACLGSSVSRCRATSLLIEGTRITQSTLAGAPRLYLDGYRVRSAIEDRQRPTPPGKFPRDRGVGDDRTLLPLVKT